MWNLNWLYLDPPFVCKTPIYLCFQLLKHLKAYFKTQKLETMNVICLERHHYTKSLLNQHHCAASIRAPSLLTLSKHATSNTIMQRPMLLPRHHHHAASHVAPSPSSSCKTAGITPLFQHMNKSQKLCNKCEKSMQQTSLYHFYHET